MNPNQLKFLTAILGEDGASALNKAVERAPALNNALIPRAVLSWIKNIDSFDGELPGLDNKIVLNKSEAGWTGSLDIKSHIYNFKDAPTLHVCAAISYGISDELTPANIKKLDIQNLGKSLDLLVKTQGVSAFSLSHQAQQGTIKANKGLLSHHEAAKMHLRAAQAFKQSGNDNNYKAHMDQHTKHSNLAANSDADLSGLPAKKNELEKIEPPTQAVAPVAPAAPVASNQTPATKPAEPKAVAKAPKPPKQGATVSLTRSQMNDAKCPICVNVQFSGNEFVGCMCFSDLKKNVEVLTVDENGCIIHVDEDMATIITLLESMGRY